MLGIVSDKIGKERVDLEAQISIRRGENGMKGINTSLPLLLSRLGYARIAPIGHHANDLANGGNTAEFEGKGEAEDART